MVEEREGPESRDVSTYDEVQDEVDRHFAGDWAKFLRAVSNPAEVLHFVLENHCEFDREKFEDWAKQRELPPDWVPRFYGALTPDGQLRTPEDVN